MKARQMMVMAVVAASFLIVGGESFARGGVAGAGGGRGQGALTMTQSMTQVNRPVDSQRRNGTFLTTGTTANGSTTRPSNGRGPMDGTGIYHPRSTTP
jgi:hypothetical protein